MGRKDQSGFDTNEETLEEASHDFGRTVRKRPRAVARPHSPLEVVEIIRRANRDCHSVTVQGAGHSQSGQSLSDGGILIDMKGLDKIGDIEDGEIQVQGGVRWRDLVHRVYAEGYLPPALTTHLTVTVGGTLSVGGLSATSHRYGLQTDNVTRMEVVTGDGRLRHCSPDTNQDLFNCARNGMGQFAAITEARIRLRKALPNVRTYSLLYEDIHAMMQDFGLLAETERIQYINGWCLPITRDLWQMLSGELFAYRVYSVFLSVEWDDAPPDQEELLSDLRYTWLAGFSDRPTLDFITMTGSNLLPDDGAVSDGRKPSSSTESGQPHLKWFDDWNQSHPCMEAMLPWDTFPHLMTDVVSRLPGPVARKARIMLGPFRRDLFKSPLFMCPDGEMFMGFGILIETPLSELEDLLPILAEESRRIINAGGKRYLSGWLDFDRQEWQNHYGEQWPRMMKWKREFDPQGVFNPGGIPLLP